MRNKVIGVILGVIAVAVVAFLIIQSITGNSGKAPATPGQTASTRALTTVKGVIGSEKADFFADARVRKIFRDNGLNVQVETAGSREIATTVNLKKYDFAFPASAPAAVKIQKEVAGTTAYAPFFSPMVIATYAPIVELLAKNGVATKDKAGVWHIDMQAYLALVEKGKRWKDLTGAADLYNSPQAVLIKSTDISKSNSAAMYLAIASYVLNDDNVVSNNVAEKKVIDRVAKLFLAQGFSESSSSEPFENYLSQGAGAVPMVMLYEAQFVGEAGKTSSRITKDMVLAYPDPTVFSKHTLLAFNAPANKVGKLLTENKDLVKLEAAYGFRTSDPKAFLANVKQHKITVNESLTNIAEVPTYDILEKMITDTIAQYN